MDFENDKRYIAFHESEEMTQLHDRINNASSKQKLINEYLLIKYDGSHEFPDNLETNTLLEKRKQYSKEHRKALCEWMRKDKEIKLKLILEELEIINLS